MARVLFLHGSSAGARTATRRSTWNGTDTDPAQSANGL
jgi:hypothetical protein